MGDRYSAIFLASQSFVAPRQVGPIGYPTFTPSLGSGGLVVHGFSKAQLNRSSPPAIGHGHSHPRLLPLCHVLYPQHPSLYLFGPCPPLCSGHILRDDAPFNGAAIRRGRTSNPSAGVLRAHGDAGGNYSHPQQQPQMYPAAAIFVFEAIQPE